MTFKDIQDEVIALRFNSAQRPYVKNWINNRYQMIWAAEDWRFKCNILSTSPNAVAGQPNLDGLPTDLGTVRELWYRKQGESMAQKVFAVSPGQFSDMYENTTLVGEPEAYTIRNDGLGPQVWVGPTPASTYQFNLYYDRRFARLSGGGVNTPGPMEADSDEPLWPVEWHHILVPAAMSLGLKLSQDPGWAEVQDDFLTQLQQMRGDLLPDSGGAGLVYHRELW